MKNETIAVIYIVLAASLWGIIGLFTRNLVDLGFTPAEVALGRCATTFIALAITIPIMDRKLFKIDPNDIWMFLGSGVLSFAFFTVMFFTTQQLTSLSVASILIYTSPCFVLILSAIFFKEKLTKNKIIALVLAFLGCVFTTGFTIGDINSGFITGILAGFGYSLYTIFAKFALKKYNLVTILFYTFFIASISLFVYTGGPSQAHMLTNSEVLLNLFGLGIVCTVIPYYIYTKALKSMDAGRASIIAFAEPLVATIVSFVIGDEIGWTNIIGISLILGALLLIYLRDPNSTKQS